MIGDAMFDVVMLMTVTFGGAAILMGLSDLATYLWNRPTTSQVGDTAGYPSQRSAVGQVEAGPDFPPLGPAHCPICVDTQPTFGVWVRAHGELVCRPCSRLSFAEAALMRGLR